MLFVKKFRYFAGNEILLISLIISRQGENRRFLSWMVKISPLGYRKEDWKSGKVTVGKWWNEASKKWKRMSFGSRYWMTACWQIRWGLLKDHTSPFLKPLFEDSGKCATDLFYPIKRSNVFYTVHAPLLTKEITLWLASSIFLLLKGFR